MEDEKKRKHIIFLSSSYVNLAKLFATINRDYDIFLILDRKFPQEIENSDLDNFYIFNFDKNKLYEKNKNSYFQTLGIFLLEYEPDIIITSNFNKILPESFIEFIKFTNNKTKIVNIQNSDLRILDENNNSRFMEMNGHIKQFIDEGMIISTIFLIENEQDNKYLGKILGYSYETTFKELKKKQLIKDKIEILNLRICNSILNYHFRTKILKLLNKIIKELLNK